MKKIIEAAKRNRIQFCSHDVRGHDWSPGYTGYKSDGYSCDYILDENTKIFEAHWRDKNEKLIISFSYNLSMFYIEASYISGEMISDMDFEVVYRNVSSPLIDLLFLNDSL